VFLIAGAAALIWSAVIVTERDIAQRSAQSALEIAIAVEELTAAAPVQKAAVPSPRPRIDRGSAIAALSIPRVQLSATVLHGSDARTLQNGPGHLEHTAVPGDAGNVVIAGHRDSFFRPLRHIRLADDIFLETRDGRFHYRVTSLRVVGPREVSVLAPTSEEVLTLITCYPFWVLGHAPDRFIVRAARVADHPSTAIEAWSLPPLDWMNAPALDRVKARESASVPIVTAGDDESLVQGTVRRYLLAQGVRFATCGVTISGDRATAACESAVPPSALEQPGRMFSLERSTRMWTIKSIELRQRE
jgi:LPXTG-site transpeptidase (sortase) family protein